MKCLRLCAIPLVIVSMLVLTATASAQEAVTTKAVNVRAGPAREYPLVVWLPGGTAVFVNGCISDYRWCDVSAGADRGWVYSKNLEYTYQGSPVPIYGNGPTLALPIISFILGSYWEDNYRDRPWYRNNNQWNNWRPGNRPPPVWRPPAPPPRPPVIRPQPPRPPSTIQPPRPPEPPHAAPPPRPQPTPRPGGEHPPRNQPSPGGQR